ncbi:hypothetical protein UP17_17165 [Peribacillus simplex]|uniref:hypothetical protein n=1 Tax=Peribacillus simplex TaxID=1478 RepID=UPI0007772209|nr:hypothetical protein [Peribacillus simplex]AMM93997.1 hypothetical protein UP17_17165 [Peribacillus simplex]
MKTHHSLREPHSGYGERLASTPPIIKLARGMVLLNVQKEFLRRSPQTVQITNRWYLFHITAPNQPVKKFEGSSQVIPTHKMIEQPDEPALED